MENFSVESVQPMSDRESPRSLAKTAIAKRRKSQYPVCNQNSAVPAPKLEIDQILSASIRLTDEELKVKEVKNSSGGSSESERQLT